METIQLAQPIQNLLILGDSYSTFEGYLPEGYRTYYTGERGTDVRCVEETWWHSFASRTGVHIARNDSWSGSCICYTGRWSREENIRTSFINRTRMLEADGFFEKEQIDTVFIFGATNDSWLGTTPKGDLILEGWTEDDLYYAVPATTYLIYKLKEILPNGNVVFLLNTHLDERIVAGVKEACKRYGASYIVLHDLHKLEGHPSVYGMKQICEQIMEACGYSFS
jgi:hypothetical protein